MTAIPTGMIAWAGGDSAPEDWDGGRTRLRGDALWYPGEWHIPTSWRWNENDPSTDIIAYTPRADEQFAENAKNSALLPCPFCGADEDDIEQAYWCDRARRNPSYVQCRRCGAEMKGKSKEAVITAWNTRPTPAVDAAGLRVAVSDPNAVHANMLRGGIAKPSLAQIIHIYGKDALTAALAQDGESGK